MRGEQLERVHLKQYRVEQQLLGGWPVCRVLRETLAYEVLLQRVVQRVYRAVDVVLGDQSARVSVALDLQRGHLQRTHAERVDVDCWTHCGR